MGFGNTAARRYFVGSCEPTPSRFPPQQDNAKKEMITTMPLLGIELLIMRESIMQTKAAKVRIHGEGIRKKKWLGLFISRQCGQLRNATRTILQLRNPPSEETNHDPYTNVQCLQLLVRKSCPRGEGGSRTRTSVDINMPCQLRYTSTHG